MKCENVRNLLLDAADGALYPGLAASVGRHLGECASCRQEAEAAAEMWHMLGELRCDPPRSELLEGLAAGMTAERASVVRRAGEGGRARAGVLERLWPDRPVIQVLMTAAALIFGLGLGIGVGAWMTRNEVRHLRLETRSMLGAASLSLLNHQSASERLRAVSLSEASSLSDDIVAALLRTIRDDPSVNVRLAALDVLSSLSGRMDVRAGLMEAFQRQESPAMQVALGEVLLKMNGERFRRDIREMMDGARLPESVRRYFLEILAGEDLDR